MADIDKQYAEMEKYVKGLENTYLAKYLADPTTTPTDYDLDVKSYCILCHAAFEEFVEGIAIEVMTQAIDAYVNTKKLSTSMVALLHFKASGEKYLNREEKEDQIEILTPYDYNRTTLNDIKSKFSNEIFNNHGVSLKYIKQLLMPVGIEIPNDTVLQSSLKQLAKERGAYAHKFLEKGTIKKSIAPESARTMVNDCLNLCKEIQTNAKAAI